jgi:uncharacterized membrane protein
MVEVAVGACIMAFPVAATEEVWNLGTDLTLWRVLLFALASVSFLAVLIYVLHGHTAFPPSKKVFLERVAGTYGITLLISALLLLGVDQLDLLQDPAIALKRTILVAFPASFAATAVDSFADDTNGS